MKFNKQNLKNKLGFSNEEVNFILKAQQEIPILASDDAFVNGRTLYEQLGISETTTKYTNFINSQLTNVDAKRDVDYFVFWIKDDVAIPVSSDDNSVVVTDVNSCFFKKIAFDDDVVTQEQFSGAGFHLDHKLTITTAKEVAMIVGTTAKKQAIKDKSKICRRYFILMETGIKRAYTWEIERDANKQEHNELMATYRQWHLERYGEEPTDYWKIQNHVYDIVFGMTAKELKDKLEVKYHENIPDNVTDKHNEAIRYAYNRFTVFLELGLSIEDCYDKTVAMFDKRYGGLMRI